MTGETREEAALRDALHLEALAVTPGPGALQHIQARINSKNGAPGLRPGTPPEMAAHLEGAPAMSHDLTDETTHRGRQFIAAFALANLLEMDLPDIASWQISDYLGEDLRGQLQVTNLSQPERLALLERWGKFLGAPVCERRGTCPAPELYVEAVYRQALVRIFCPEVGEGGIQP